MTRKVYNKKRYIMTEDALMGVTLNPNKEIVKVVKEGLKRTGGYCPCIREQSEDTKCMCKQFREQIKDREFEGFCHCMLYYKSKD